MRTFIDPSLCTSCGLCIDACPELYDFGDEAVVVIADPVPAGRENCAVEAEEGCPVEAITHTE